MSCSGRADATTTFWWPHDGAVIGKGWLAIAVVVVLAVGVVAFVSLGRGVSGTPAQRLSSWASSTELGQVIGTLEGDGASAAAAARQKDAKALSTVCAAMANAAQTANDQLPSPDSEITQRLARAYSSDYDAAESCYRAGPGGTALLSQFERDRQKATALFDSVLRRVRRVTSHSVPTTTTTVPYEGTSTAVL